MRKIQCVTFPRSGHHLLVNMLFKYFSKDVKYPEILGGETHGKGKEIIRAGNIYYCEFYAHCLTSFCTDPKTNFQKNHDADDLSLKNPDYYYIIQFRNPMHAITSFYNFELYGGWVDKPSREWFR